MHMNEVRLSLMQADSRSPVPLSSGKRFPNPAGNLMLVQEIPKHDVTLVVLGPRLIKKIIFQFQPGSGQPLQISSTVASLA